MVDGTVAFVGGINVIDDRNCPGQTPPRVDFGVRVEGPLAAEVRAAAADLWVIVSLANFQPRWSVAAPAAVGGAPPGYQRAALVVRDNLRHRSDIEDAYLHAIATATDEIVIACAYFFPGRAFRRALAEAAARGVTVKLVLQRRVEYVLLHYASRALYGTMLDAGVQIYEYSRSFLHAKVAVVDGRWATVGSSNIDPFSLLLAREANVVADDRRFAQEVRDALHRMIEHRLGPGRAAALAQEAARAARAHLAGLRRVAVADRLFGYGGRGCISLRKRGFMVHCPFATAMHALSASWPSSCATHPRRAARPRPASTLSASATSCARPRAAIMRPTRHSASVGRGAPDRNSARAARAASEKSAPRPCGVRSGRRDSPAP